MDRAHEKGRQPSAFEVAQVNARRAVRTSAELNTQWHSRVPAWQMEYARGNMAGYKDEKESLRRQLADSFQAHGEAVAELKRRQPEVAVPSDEFLSWNVRVDRGTFVVSYRPERAGLENGVYVNPTPEQAVAFRRFMEEDVVLYRHGDVEVAVTSEVTAEAIHAACAHCSPDDTWMPRFTPGY